MKDEGSMAIGARIRQVRTNSGMTLMQLGAKAGVNFTNIGKYERGEERPAVETLKKLAAALEITTDYILYGEENKKDKLLQYFTKAQALGKDDKKQLIALLAAFFKEK
jgi:transcriptional regulator with XRE-family HTH domain